VRAADGQSQLATRRLDQSQLTPLSGTEGAGSPFFSTDGQWIAFFADGKLKKIAVQGGAPVTLSDASTFRMGPMSPFPAGSWGDDGNIIAMLHPTVGLTRVASTGGQPAPLTVLPKAEGEIDNWPQVLPGSQAVLFTRLTGDIDYDYGNIEVVSLKTGTRKTLLKGGFLGRYLPSGHLVYVHQNTIFAVPFDLSRLATAGAPQPMLDVGGRLGCRNFDFSQTGSFVSCQPGNPPLSIFWLNNSGTPLPLQDVPGSSYSGPRFSPDGKRLAFSMTSQGHQDIWVQDLDRGATSRLTALPGVNDNLVWTADGLNLIFRSSGQSKPGIYGVRADGSAEAQRLLDLSTGDFPYSVSPDGKRLAIWDSGVGGMIWTAPVESGRNNLSLGKGEPFLQAGRFNPALPGRSAPAFSPDSRWMAYCSNESGRLEVYVVPFPGPGGKWRISTGGGKFPIWSRNGRDLFFLDLDSSKIMVASYKETADSFSAANPRVWSEKRVLDLGVSYSYDLAPDGNRFAAVLYADGSSEQKPVTNLAFLLNFFDELRRRIPPEAK
jgi:serine/threonine-protein kinase